MSFHIPSQTATSAWERLIFKISTAGRVVSPRGMRVYECLNSSISIDMRCPVILTTQRKLSYKFMAAEAWWILSGRDDVASISKYCKAISQFSDDGLTFFGAYGPKIVSQIDGVVDKIVQDPDTRQALLTIWRENPRPTRDVPCTVSAQWLVRDGHLHCIDTMRSNDAWLGFPYDVFNFSMLSWHILNKLRERGHHMRLGNLYLNAGSHHLYEKNYETLMAWPNSHWNEFHHFPVLGGYPTESDIVVELGSILGEYPSRTTEVSPFFRCLSQLF